MALKKAKEPPSLQANQWKKKVAEAESLRKQGKMENALSLYQTVIDATSSKYPYCRLRLDVIFIKIYLLLELAQDAEGLEAARFNVALIESFDSTPAQKGRAYNILARALWQNQKMEESIEPLKKAIEAYDADKNVEKSSVCLMNLGSSLKNAGQFSEAVDAFLRATAYFSAVKDHARLSECYLQVAECYHHLSEGGIYGQYMEMALVSASATSDVLAESKIFCAYSMMKKRRAEIPAAEELAERAVSLSRESGLEEAYYLSLIQRIQIWQEMLELQPATQALDELFRHTSRLNYPTVYCAALTLRGAMLLESGLEEAMADIDLAQKIIEVRRSDENLVSLLLIRAENDVLHCRWDSLETHLNAAEEAIARLHQPRLLPLVWSHRGVCALMCGNLHESRRLLEQALESYGHSGDIYYLTETRMFLIRVYRLLSESLCASEEGGGNFAEKADTLLSEVQAVVEKSGSPRLMTNYRRLWAWMAGRAGHYDKALKILRELSEHSAWLVMPASRSAVEVEKTAAEWHLLKCDGATEGLAALEESLLSVISDGDMAYPDIALHACVLLREICQYLGNQERADIYALKAKDICTKFGVSEDGF